MRRTFLIGAALALLLATPAAQASKKILVYSSGGKTDTAYFPVAPDPSAPILTLATDAMWRSYTTTDFKSYDALWVDAGNCGISASATSATPWVPTQFQALYDTRLTWSAALTGHFEIIGSDEDFHASTFGSQKFIKNSYYYVTSGAGTGLFISTGCMYAGAPADTPVPFLEGIGVFHVTGDGCTDGQVFELPSHPIVVGTSPPASTLALSDLGWSCFTHSHYNLTPPSYARVIDIGGTGAGHGVVIAHDVGGCAIDRDCPTGTTCHAPVCLPGGATKDPGFGCVTGSDCTTGICVDGTCCDKACTDQCAACDVVGAKGTCTPVVGAPHGTRAACPGGGAACSAICDGKITTSCAGFPDKKKVCAPGSCTSGVATDPSYCDGAGKCVPGGTKTCEAFVCAGPECATTCAKVADCAPGHDCVGGICVAVDAGVGPGDATGFDASGSDGGGLDGGGLDGSSGGDASVSGDGSFDDGGGSGGDPTAETGNKGGCSCDVPGTTSTNAGAYAVVLAALGLVAMRRRRR